MFKRVKNMENKKNETYETSYNALPKGIVVDLDVEYLLHQSTWIDIKIIWLTFIKVLKKDGISH